MNVAELKQFCLEFNGSQEDEKSEPSNILSYKVGGKNFAYFKTSEPEKWRFSIRISPDLFLSLTDMPNVKPARYMQRFHWITIVKVESFDENYLKELIHSSYQKALSSLSKKKQNEILGNLLLDNS